MARRILSDRRWRRIAPHLPGKRGDRGRSGTNNRRTVAGILWIARTGAPGRDRPPELGRWNTVYRRFRRWALTGALARLFQLLMPELLDRRVVMVDGTFVKVHQHGAGSPKGTALPVVRPSAAVAEGRLQRYWRQPTRTGT